MRTKTSWRHLTRALVAIGVLPVAGIAQTALDPNEVDLLPLDEEVELALSAAPAHLRAEATVFALTADGFEMAQEGTNGFSCVVNRDHPLNPKPTCYDAEGTATILPKVLLMSELMLAGVPMSAIADTVASGFASGRFKAPSRPGVAYMLTRGIRTYNPRNQTFGSFPPHVMFYAPGMTNADIGTSFPARREAPYLPFIAYQGPHGFMVVVVGDGT